ncbi:MAG: hypothetical protein CMJ58_06735 [Planctomycetaceae bacterium]|nr:hypothetical protein [Planctomycetaceae bacterium]
MGHGVQPRQHISSASVWPAGLATDALRVGDCAATAFVPCGVELMESVQWRQPVRLCIAAAEQTSTV